MVKRYRTTFLGDEAVFLDTIRSNSELHLIVCGNKSEKIDKIFGSAYDYAKRKGIPCISPLKYFRKPVPTDIMIVSGYPKLLKKRQLKQVKVAVVNIHQSLLPAYRGRHPLNWAIIQGEKYSGVTLHRVDGKFDNGNIILQKRVRINKDDTVVDLYLKTAAKGKDILAKMLRITDKNSFKGNPQSKINASYFPVRRPDDGRINWAEDAYTIRNLVRALVYPYPGAYFYWHGEKIIVEEAAIGKNINRIRPLGEPFLYNGGIVIRTGKGYIKLLKVRNFEKPIEAVFN